MSTLDTGHDDRVRKFYETILREPKTAPQHHDSRVRRRRAKDPFWNFPQGIRFPMDQRTSASLRNHKRRLGGKLFHLLAGVAGYFPRAVRGLLLWECHSGAFLRCAGDSQVSPGPKRHPGGHQALHGDMLLLRLLWGRVGRVLPPTSTTRMARSHPHRPCIAAMLCSCAGYRSERYRAIFGSRWLIRRCEPCATRGTSSDASFASLPSDNMLDSFISSL